MVPSQKFGIEIQERLRDELGLEVAVTPVDDQTVRLLYKGNHPVHGPYEIESTLEVDTPNLQKALVDIATAFRVGPLVRAGFSQYQK